MQFYSYESYWKSRRWYCITGIFCQHILVLQSISALTPPAAHARSVKFCCGMFYPWSSWMLALLAVFQSEYSAPVYSCTLHWFEPYARVVCACGRRQPRVDRLLHPQPVPSRDSDLSYLRRCGTPLPRTLEGYSTGRSTGPLFLRLSSPLSVLPLNGRWLFVAGLQWPSSRSGSRASAVRP